MWNWVHYRWLSGIIVCHMIFLRESRRLNFFIYFFFNAIECKNNGHISNKHPLWISKDLALPKRRENWSSDRVVLYPHRMDWFRSYSIRPWRSIVCWFLTALNVRIINKRFIIVFINKPLHLIE